VFRGRVSLVAYNKYAAIFLIQRGSIRDWPHAMFQVRMHVYQHEYSDAYILSNVPRHDGTLHFHNSKSKLKNKKRGCMIRQEQSKNTSALKVAWQVGRCSWRTQSLSTPLTTRTPFPSFSSHGIYLSFICSFCNHKNRTSKCSERADRQAGHTCKSSGFQK
jgi:hypothetical protein